MTDANPAACKMLGMSKAEICAKGRAGIVEYSPALTAAIEERRRTGSASAELTFIRKDGTRLPVELTSIIAGGAPGAERSFVIFRDISGRKRAEEALRVSEARMQAIVGSTLDHIIVQDCELRYELVINPQLGLTAADMLGKTDVEFLPQADAERLIRIKRQVIETGKAVRATEALKNRQGEQEFFDGFFVPRRNAEGQVDGVIGYFRNVTDRKRAESERRESEERLRLAAVTTGLGMWDWYPLTGAQWWDARAHELWWLPPDAPIDMETFEQRIHPADRERVRNTVRGVFNRESVSGYPIKFRLFGPEGQQRWVEANARVFFDGEIAVRVVGTVVDITERMAEEERLKRLCLGVSEADKRKNEFLGMLSHELRNPLTPIRNSLYVLERAAPGGEQARRAHMIIDRQVNHMTRLVDDLLDVTRISRGKVRLQRTRLDLVEVIRRTIEDHHTLLADRNVVIELPNESIRIEGDAVRLAQMIGNLLSNAAKFTSSDGRISVSLARTNDRAVLEVADTGIGIDRDTLERLFEPFEQADRSLDRSRGGLGLGLALVKGMVELHGGTVRAHSDGMGRGSRFVIELPLDERGAANRETMCPSPPPFESYS